MFKKKIFPIKKNEAVKFAIISSMMILIIFVYSAQRATKDTMIVPILGPELIYTIKLWGVFPSAVLVMLLYARLCDFFKKTDLFYIFNAIFVIYFLLFTFVLNTNVEKYCLDLRMQKEMYCCLYNPILMLENWFYSLYYIYSELWGSVMLALIFWQIANQVFSVEQARRLYPLLGFFGQLGMLLSDTILTFATNGSISLDWQESLVIINSFVLCSSLVLSISFLVLTKIVIAKKYFNQSKIKKKNKSFFDSLAYIARSKYLMLISTTIVCYGVSINLIEGPWKAQVRLLYPDQKSFAAFQAKLQGYTGKTSMIIMAIGSYILKMMSWRTAAILTPMVIFISGSVFFVFSIFQSKIGDSISISAILIAVIAGFAQNVITKSTKYVFFDSTKEIAYIPLDDSLKSKGKAAADIIGGRLGKSGGAAIQFLILLIPGTDLITISPILFLIFISVMLVWFTAVNILAREFYKITEKS